MGPHLPQQKVKANFNYLLEYLLHIVFIILIRLKSILSGFSENGVVVGGDEEFDEDGPVVPRKRSNSVPIPQIEVTACGGGADGGDRKDDDEEDGDRLEAVAKDGSGAFHARATSLGGKGGRRKKSLISTGMEVTRLKHFKSFVESKILSKSDRSLAGGEGDEATTPTGESAAKSGLDGQPPRSTPSSLSTATRDYFKRRSSRSSFTELDPLSSPTKAVPHSSSQQMGASSSGRVSETFVTELYETCKSVSVRRLNLKGTNFYFSPREEEAKGSGEGEKKRGEVKVSSSPEKWAQS